MRIALSLFWSWLFSSWHVTTSPVGLCVMRTAESVVFTDCPPGPVERYTSISRSLGSISTSTSSASGSTATVAALGVDAALALGRRHPLHAVRAAFVLEPAPRVVALHDERDVAEAAHVRRLARQHLGLPAVALGVVLVHPVEVAGPEVGLLAALGAPDLDDHVLAVVGVAGAAAAP